MNVMTHRIQPSIDMLNGLIALDEFQKSPMTGMVEQFARHVVDTRDQAVRNALIALGWTPPPAPHREPQQTADTPLRLLHRAADPDTSAAAAERSSAFACSHRERILAAIGEFELSVLQIATRSGLKVEQVGRRLHELQKDGRVRVVQDADGDMVRGGYRVWARALSRA